MTYSDEQLMLLFGQGQSSAFDELYYRHDRRISAFVGRMTGWQEADVQNITQDIFLRVARAASSYSPSAKFSTWLYRVATNCCLNDIKRRKRHPHLRVIEGSIQSSKQTVDPVCQMIEDEGHRALQNALSKLPPEQKTVFLLRQTEGLSYEDISRIVDKPLGTVKTNIYRARTELVRTLGSFLEKTEESQRKEQRL